MQSRVLVVATALVGLIAPVVVQAQQVVPVEVRIQPLSSQVVALSWATEKQAYARVEYSTTPLPNSSSSFFPLPPMSSTGYTRLRSRNHDLCPTDLTPDTLYYARVWNTTGGGNGKPDISPTFTFRTPPAPANLYSATKDAYGLQLAEEWRALKDATKKRALGRDYVRVLEVLQQWDEIQPARGTFLWSNIDGTGLDDQLADLKQRAGSKIGQTKFIQLKIRAGGPLKGRRMPSWAGEGVESVSPDGPAHGEEDRVIRWDPQYVCRYLQLMKTAGDRYGADPAVHIVPIQATSKTGEMGMSPVLLEAYRDLGYTDPDIAENLGWLYRHVLQVYAEAFPHQALQMNMGLTTLMAGGQDVGYTVLDEAAARYGKRIRFGTTGFGGVNADLLTRYEDQVVVGGFSEQPPKDSTDPVGDLGQVFDLVWPHASGLGWVGLHHYALALQGTWKTLPELLAFLEDVESQFALLRELP